MNKRTRSAIFSSPLLRRPDLRIILTGAGSSAFIGECLAPLLLRRLGPPGGSDRHHGLAGRPARSICSGTYRRCWCPSAARATVPRVWRSSTWRSRLLRECHQLVFTCNEHGTLYQRCRERANSLAILLPPETHDQSFAMTSSFTAMMLAASLAFDGNSVGVAQVARATQALLARAERGAAHACVESYSRVVYLGSNGLKALAREAALKLHGAERWLGDRGLRFAARLSSWAEDHHHSTTRWYSCSSPTMPIPAAMIWTVARTARRWPGGTGHRHHGPGPRLDRSRGSICA